MKTLAAVLVFLGIFGGLPARQSNPLSGQAAPVKSGLLSRHYQADEKLSYWMTGVNQGRHYKIRAGGVVEKLPDGIYVEKFAWSNLTMEGVAVPLSAASASFRQTVSLDPRYRLSIPDLSRIQPALIGPITDLLTFYADDWLAAHTGQLNGASDHFYFKYGTPSSWADGMRVVLGESSIDFDMTLSAVDQHAHTAMLIVRHVPPAQPQIKLPADWMRAPVAGTPNNWVEVEKKRDGKYAAEVGKETFAVKIEVSLIDGRIVSGSIDDAVEVVERECTDAALANCEKPSREHIQRTIGLEASAE